MPEESSNKRLDKPSLSIKEVARLTRAARYRERVVEFAGFLTYEDEDAIYVADPRGTWMIPRDSIDSTTEWKSSECAAEYLRNSGKPVRICIKDGSTIYKLRPWHIDKQGCQEQMRSNRAAIDSVFTLDAGSLPMGARTALGERELARLTNLFSRRLGWDPDNSPSTQLYFDLHFDGPTVDCSRDGGCTCD